MCMVARSMLTVKGLDRQMSILCQTYAIWSSYKPGWSNWGSSKKTCQPRFPTSDIDIPLLSPNPESKQYWGNDLPRSRRSALPECFCFHMKYSKITWMSVTSAWVFMCHLRWSAESVTSQLLNMMKTIVLSNQMHIWFWMVAITYLLGACACLMVGFCFRCFACWCLWQRRGSFVLPFNTWLYGGQAFLFSKVHIY